MKASTSLAIIAGAAAVLASRGVDAADACSVRGGPCTNAQGQASRCGHDWACMPDLTPCSANSTRLQRCSQSREAFCFPLPDSETLQCLDAVQIETIVQRNACAGERDGTSCKSAFVEGLGEAGLAATVFEQDGLCEEAFCLSTEFTACDDASLGAACATTSVLDGNVVLATGVCVPEEPHRPWCKTSSNATVVLRRATVLFERAPLSAANAVLPRASSDGSASTENKSSSTIVAAATTANRTASAVAAKAIETPSVAPVPGSVTPAAVKSASSPSRLALSAATLSCIVGSMALLVL